MSDFRYGYMFGLLMACVQSASALGPASDDQIVAGLQPDRRPVAAPFITGQPVDAATLERRLRGVSKPVPGNVSQIAATGAWFVPLRLPGMSGPYDIRGWHSSAAPAVAAPNPAAVSKP